MHQDGEKKPPSGDYCGEGNLLGASQAYTRGGVGEGPASSGQQRGLGSIGAQRPSMMSFSGQRVETRSSRVPLTEQGFLRLSRAIQ